MGAPEEIERSVRERGPITFAEFMELALYGPGGYYETPPVGVSGDFVTSPHVHPVFGELLAVGLRELWTSLGRPEPFRLIEAGAGDGTLAAQLAASLADVPLEYTAVERSAGARKRLAAEGVAVAESIAELAPVEGCIVANELLDNLPFRVVRGTAAGPVEVRVGWSDGGPLEVELPCDDDLGSAAAQSSLEPGAEITVPVGAREFVDQLAWMMKRGYVLLIDYGGTSSRTAGPVHGYREHRVVKDVLSADPGAIDITAGVDFRAIADRARSGGLTPIGPVSQRAALLGLGFERWILEERRRQKALLAGGAGTEAVRTWGGRSRATLLVDPAGLGRLRWLVLATRGLPPPGWTSDAPPDDAAL